MKILMVCLGNICRSPLAHGILDHLAKKEGLDWTIESAGTGDWHIGQSPDQRSIAVAKKYEVDISLQRARHFDSSLFAIYDHILVMDHQNYKDVLKQASTEDEKAKVALFLVDDVVPDPYFDERLFEPVYKMIESRCQELIQAWR